MKAIYMVCTRRNPDFTLTRIATDRADNADVLGNVTCIIESLRFRLVAYSRCASHGRSAPRCALRFRRSKDIEFLTL